MEIVIPEASKKDDDFELHVTDHGLKTAFVDIEYLGLATVIIDPIYGSPGQLIQVYGNAAALTAQMNVLVAPRVVFTPEFLLSITTIILMVLSSVLVPVYFASRHVEEYVDLLR